MAERIAEDRSIWYSLGDCRLCDDQSDTGLGFRERLKTNGMGVGEYEHITYQWSFPNYPGGSKRVIMACEEHVRRLWRFIYEFWMKWETPMTGALGTGRSMAFLVRMRNNGCETM